MKRHTIFIYTAALLTMLSTVLPMSAQNKSFTVNRNDGASQKYSYSQGDRLVLSREDSQGKKHADFVEQQVHVGNAVHNIPLTSIESITFDTQTTEDEGKTFTVQESGGKIEYDDITIDFPSGTFNSSTKVTVSEVEKGKIDGEDELSKYYKVKFGGGVRKSFNVGVKSPEYADDNALKMQFAMMGFAPSLGEQMMAPNLIDVSYLDNSYVAEIPEMDSPDDVDNIEVYFGLRNYVPIEIDSTAFTRAIYLWDYNIIPLSTVGKEVFWKLVSSWIPDAINKIEELGFRKYGIEPGIVTPSQIQYYLYPKDDKNNNGCCICCPWSKASSIIWINSNIFLGNDVNTIRETIIHETLHYYQLFYDIRSASVIFAQGHTKATILEEASSTWIERYYGEKLSKNTRDNVDKFLPSLNPDHDDILGDDVTGEGEKRYQNLGYGMSALLEYLSQKKGDDIVLDMWKRRGGSINPFNTIGFVEDAAKNKGIDIFTQKEYKVFVEALGLRKVYGELGFSDMVSDVRGSHNNQGGMTHQKISVSKPAVTLVNWVYGYGALLEHLEVEIDKNVEELKYRIKQTTQGVKTWVYVEKREKGTDPPTYEYVGMITDSDSPMDISDWFYKTKKNEYLTKYNFHMVTIADDFKTSEDILSKIEVNIEENVEFKVEPDHLDYEAGGGTKKLTVTTNQPKFKSELDEDSQRKGWLKRSDVNGGVDVTATPNTDPTPREGYVIVTPINAKGKAFDDKAVKIPVKQKAASPLEVSPSEMTLPGYSTEFKGGEATIEITVKFAKDGQLGTPTVKAEPESWLTMASDWSSKTTEGSYNVWKRNFTVKVNPSFKDPRYATVTFTMTMPDGNNPEPKSVEIVQQPMQAELSIDRPQVDLKAEDGMDAATSDVQTVNIISNIFEDGANIFKSEEFSTSGDKGGKGGDWIHYERNGKSIDIWADAYQEETGFRDGVLTYTVTTTTGEQKSASVKVKQWGRAVDLPFYIVPSQIRFPYEGGELDVAVMGDKVEKIANFDFVWNEVSRGFLINKLTDKSLRLVCQQNPYKEERCFVFHIIADLKDGTQYNRFFVVYQDGLFNVEPNELTFPSEKKSATIKILTATPGFKATTEADWITLSENHNANKVTVEAEANTSSEDREAIVTIYALNDAGQTWAVKTIPVKQEGDKSSYTLKIIPDHLDFDSNRGTQTVEVVYDKADLYFERVDNSSENNKELWFEASGSLGAFNVTVKENNSTKPRDGYIYFFTVNEKGEKDIKGRLPIKQKGMDLADFFKQLKSVRISFSATLMASWRNVDVQNTFPPDEKWATNPDFTVSTGNGWVMTPTSNGLSATYDKDGTKQEITIQLDPAAEKVTNFSWKVEGSGKTTQGLTWTRKMSFNGANLPIDPGYTSSGRRLYRGKKDNGCTVTVTEETKDTFGLIWRQFGGYLRSFETVVHGVDAESNFTLSLDFKK